MEEQLNKFVRDLRAEDFAPIFALLQNPQAINLAVATSYRNPPAHIIEAAKGALEDGRVHYGPNPGLPELRETIADKLKARNGLEMDPESEIIVTSGAGTAFLHALIAILEPGDEVLVADPSFPLSTTAVEMLGARPVHYSVKKDCGFDFDESSLDRLVSDKTKLLILVNPDNPTGLALQQRQLQKIAELAVKHNFFVLSDEAYEALTFGEAGHHSIATIEGMKERAISVFSFSKDYGISGLRIGYACGSKELISALTRIQMNDGAGANVPGQVAAISALRGRQDFLNEWRLEYRRTRDVFVERLNAIPGVVCPRPMAGYYVFPNVAEIADEQTVWEKLLTDARVATSPGHWYGALGSGHIRICFANEPPERAMQGLTRIEQSLRTMQ